MRDWPSDGISLQTGKGCRVSKCIVTGCLGNGLHPGTGLSQSRFEENHVSENGAGLYFCWHNRQHVVRKNLILRNRGAGIAGLGNPGDRENLIEENVIADNGGPGIEINGGMRSGNVIRRNLIENNSQAQPGKHPGVALRLGGGSRDYTIEGNTIRDTQKSPTQVVGVEEKDGSYRGKPTHADENLIRDNVFSGHRKADVLLTGPATRCERNGEATVRREPVTEPHDSTSRSGRIPRRAHCPRGKGPGPKSGPRGFTPSLSHRLDPAANQPGSSVRKAATALKVAF